MKAFSTKMIRKAIILIALCFALSHPALAQSCALCRTQAAGATSRFIAALKEGIWVLIFPSFIVCTALSSMAYRRRDRFHDSDTETDTW